MRNMDPFSAQIVQFVRKDMSDEAILELVRNKLLPEELGTSPRSPNGASAKSAAPSKAKAAAKPRRKAAAKKKAVVKKAATPKKSSTKAKKKSSTKKKSRPTKDRSAELKAVETVISGSKGLSASEIAKKSKLPQGRVSTLVRTLKNEGRIFQGGDRRFARYAGDAKTAVAASEHARKTASGPKR